MKDFGTGRPAWHFESIFFALSVLLALAFGLVTYDPTVFVPARAAPIDATQPDYRLTITARRLPSECLTGGEKQGTVYCDSFLNQSVGEIMHRRTGEPKL